MPVETNIELRPAVPSDVAVLELWDLDPDVVRATNDDPEAEKAFEGAYWPAELAMMSDVYRYYIAELDGRPIGAVLIIDPREEPTHYWGEIEPGLRAVDIWIGAASDRAKGYGTMMMRRALCLCFAAPDIDAVIVDPLASNERAHRFYQRLGFAAEGRRTLGEEDCVCLVHRLARQTWQQRFPEDA